MSHELTQNETEDLVQLLQEELPQERVEKLLARTAEARPDLLQHLSAAVIAQRRELRGELARARTEVRRARQKLEGLEAPPLHPALVVEPAGERVEVLCSGQRLVIPVHPSLRSALAPGDAVLLSSDRMQVVALAPTRRPTGAVATVVAAADGRAVLLTPGEGEVAALCPEELVPSLEPGDRVVYLRELPLVLERLAEESRPSCAFECPTPPPGFEAIGGLDALIAEIRRDLDLHLLHAEQVAAYRLELMRGLTLVGPPGVGKTLLAGAIARYLADLGRPARFLHVTPGALRGSYYGESEARIRNLFQSVRRAPGLVVLAFDEIDSFGRRSERLGHEIDGRVLGTLLAELDGLSARGDLLVVGATNRLDLCDPALVRPGRFGDRIYTIPRPGREATRAILARYLTEDLPYAAQAEAGSPAEMLCDAVTDHLFAPRDESQAWARVTLASGEVRALGAPDLMSGALLQSLVQRAKHAAASRALAGGPGLSLEDLLRAAEEAVAAELAKLDTAAAARRVLCFEGAREIVRIERPAGGRLPQAVYVRAA